MTVNEFAEQHLDVHYVVMESSPVTWRYAGDENSMEPEWVEGMAPAICKAIKDGGLLDVDEGKCALCTTSIGYLLHDDDDDPSGNGVHWHWTTAAYYGRHADVLLLCEECSPHRLRDLFEERANRTMFPSPGFGLKFETVVTPALVVQWRREYGESLGVTSLRSLAHDMPYKGESSKAEIIDWLLQYAPGRLDERI